MNVCSIKIPPKQCPPIGGLLLFIQPGSGARGWNTTDGTERKWNRSLGLGLALVEQRKRKKEQTEAPAFPLRYSEKANK